MIDHLTIHVSDYEASKAFYLAALAPLGYATVMELHQSDIPSLPVAHVLGLGVGGKPDLWLRPTARSSSIRTATTSKPSVTRPSSGHSRTSSYTWTRWGAVVAGCIVSAEVESWCEAH